MTPKDHKKVLIDYMYGRIDLEDWHGVADAANDLRELEAANPELKKNVQEKAPKKDSPT